MKTYLERPLFWLILAFLPALAGASPAVALACGVVVGNLLRRPLPAGIPALSRKLLQGAVVLLGFGLNLETLFAVGVSSVQITLFTVAGTICFGLLLGHWLKIPRELCLLLSGGTAICGGSAIAALSPTIRASHTTTALAMGIVFILNGIALFIFPPLGHWMGLSQEQFGFWAALAIHDTSSVVGAAATYGSVALAVGTTVKLTRALWIFPLSFMAGFLTRSRTRPPFQWFLVGFVGAAAFSTFFPSMNAFWSWLVFGGHTVMVASLFLVGLLLRWEDLRKIGPKSMAMAVLLWIVAMVVSLLLVKMDWLPVLHLPPQA